jgi:nickel-dependent lactate racemase
MTADRDITLKYGTVDCRFSVPSSVTVDEFSASRVERPITFDQFKADFDKSNGRSFLESDRLLFVVNDAYRHTPTELVLGWLEQLVPGVVARADYIIATGSHEPPTEAQLSKIFGAHLSAIRSRVSWHEATNGGSMHGIGRDAFGQQVFVNRAFLEHKSIVVIGSVEPHYFAGYTGGRKSIFPGLIDLATIERNHNLANSLEARPLRLQGNPVNTHLQSLMKLVDLSKIFSIQLVADSSSSIGSVFFGPLENSFTSAVEYAKLLYARLVGEKYDVVLCEILPPLDKNLYQAQKGLENCEAGVADGGAIIVVSPCDEGIGSTFFYELASHWDREKNEPNDGVLHFGSHKLARVNLMTRRIDVRVHSTLPADKVRKVFYEPAVDLAEFVNDKVRAKNNLRLAVVHDAGHTVLTTSQ